MRHTGISENLLLMLNGPLEPVRKKLSFGEEQREIVTSRKLLTADTLAGIMERYGQRFGIKPDRYLVSLWSQKYLATLIVPVIALTELCGRTIDANIQSTSFVLDENGEPVALRLSSSFVSERKEAAATTLLSTHLEPFVEIVSGWSGLSQKILWGNAAHYLEWIIGQVTGHPALIELPNPMANAIRYVEEKGMPVRRRKVCCLRYKVPGVEHCGRLCPDRKMRAMF